MIEAGAPSTGRSQALFPECARPTGGSHGRTARGPAQRGEGARRRPRQGGVPKSAANDSIKAGARKTSPARLTASEGQVENTVGRFRTIIERTGGEAGEPNHWSRRKLAYEIDHRTDGFYVVMEFTAGERTLDELKRVLRVSDDVLRHMVVKLPPGYAHKPLRRPSTPRCIGSSTGP
jgi:small subunit ribosomal protein S6